MGVEFDSQQIWGSWVGDGRYVLVTGI